MYDFFMGSNCGYVFFFYGLGMFFLMVLDMFFLIIFLMGFLWVGLDMVLGHP